ncbi:FkbM family methyltransferase [Natronorubrum sp. DTA7]|uniref:FkbM family methyltransferase n=1 Tax=Natronorubrum sp. DTA7 TaxID=3447016 RepID=UPI003F861E75
MNEEEMIRDLCTELQSDDVFYDIGANVGVYSCLAGAVTTEGKVVAFEPHPENVRALTDNIDRNGVDATILETALSDESDTLVLSEDGSEAGRGEHQLTDGTHDDGIQIDVQTLDEMCLERDFPKPNVLKIDVEGAEWNVIKGGLRTLSADDCRLIYCEIHPDAIETFGGSYDDIVDSLAECGFTVEATYGGEGTSNPMIKATK